MTIASICTAAMEEVGSFEIPSNFVGNANLTARQAVALVQRTGNTLERQHRFTALLKTATITTVADQANYDLPTDFRAHAPMSHWDQTNQRQLLGPTSSAQWSWLKSDITAGATIDRWWREQAGQIYIHPTPTVDGETLYYEYYSRNWITRQSDSSAVREWSADADTSLIDEDLLTLALKWRLLQAKGMPYEPEYREYEAMLEQVLADGGSKGKINLGPPRIVVDNIPDRGFGA